MDSVTGCASGHLDPGDLERHLLEDMHAIGRMITELHQDWARWRPLLAVLDPNGAATDVQRAGLLRAMRKAARKGPMAQALAQYGSLDAIPESSR